MCLLKRKPPIVPPPSKETRLQRSMDQNLPSSSLSMDSGTSSSKLSGISTSSTSSLAGIKDWLAEGPIIYAYKEILKVTNNFSSQKLGNSLWKGTLRNVSVVLVKKQGCVSDFVDALKSVGSVHHINIVRLLGACHEGQHVYLAYEFVEGGNLRQLIRSQTVTGYSALSTWKSRMQIAVDVAQGLEYLHHHTELGFIHKYIQTTKILVSNQFRAKIAYFGVAELTGEVRSGTLEMHSLDTAAESEEIEGASHRKFVRSNSIKIVGTQGYMAPEYITSGIITSKYDVFAFGIVLLELLSGQEAIVKHNAAWKLSKKVTLPEMVNSLMNEPDSKARLRQWIDPVLRDSYPVEDAYKVLNLAKSCVDKDPQKRPGMSLIKLKLSKYLASSEKWEATVGTGMSMISASLQPR